MTSSTPSSPIANVAISVGTILHIIFCFIAGYSLVIILIVPLLLLLCYRCILSTILTFAYNGRYKLFESTNGIHGMDLYANIYTIYYSVYIDGPCDIDFLRQRMHQIFTKFKTSNGTKPYEMMLCKIVKKFGFYCWENIRDSFDINYHVRYFPGCSELNRIYTESEVYEAQANLADDTWDKTKPRWEFLVVPQMKKDDTGMVCSVIHMRIQHSYADGISVGQIARLCVFDQPPPNLTYDSVNPPGPGIPIYMKLFMYLQVFFLGPWTLMKFASNKERHIFYEGPLKGGKFMGRTSIDISIPMMREIRKYHGVSTTAIEHFALTGAMTKMALRRGMTVPHEILGSITSALIPYPHPYPQNRITMFLEKFPLGIQDPLERLSEINKICRRTNSPTSYYIALTSRVMNRVTGILPASLIEKMVVLIELSYCVSNVPGIKERGTFNGYPVANLTGVGPLLNGFRYVVGVGCYEDIFTFGFHCEKSKLIKNRDDLLELIREFENEIRFLMQRKVTD